MSIRITQENQIVITLTCTDPEEECTKILLDIVDCLTQAALQGDVQFDYTSMLLLLRNMIPDKDTFRAYYDQKEQKAPGSRADG